MDPLDLIPTVFAQNTPYPIFTRELLLWGGGILLGLVCVFVVAVLGVFAVSMVWGGYSLGRQTKTTKEPAPTAKRANSVFMITIAILMIPVLGIGGCTAAYVLALRTSFNQSVPPDNYFEMSRLDDATLQDSLQGDYGAYASQVSIAEKTWEEGDPIAALRHLNGSSQEFRHWEYDYLSNLFSANQRNESEFDNLRVWSNSDEPLTSSERAGATISVAFSPDGERVATVSWNQTPRLWDARSGRLIHALAGHDQVVDAVIFSPDGKWIATGSRDATIKLWDAKSGREVRTFTGHRDGVTSLDFDPIVDRIVSGSFDNTVNVWDVNTGEVLLTLTGHAGQVRDVAFNVRGDRIASAGGSYKTGEVRLWDGHTGTELWADGHFSLPVRTVAFCSVSGRVAAGSDDGMLSVWNSETGENVLFLKAHEQGTRAVAFSPDGKRLVSGGNDKKVKLWEPTTGCKMIMLRGNAAEVTCVAFSPDGSRIASSGLDNTIRIWSSGQDESR